MSTPIPPAGSGIATQTGSSVTAASGASGANSGNVSGGTAGSIPNPPPAIATALQQLGSTITGTLAVRSDAQITLNTPQGPVQVALSAPLPAAVPSGATLILQVADLGPPLQVLVQQPPAKSAPAGTAAGTIAGGKLHTPGAPGIGAAASGAGKATAQTLAGTPVTTSLTQGATIAATVSGASFSLPSGTAQATATTTAGGSPAAQSAAASAATPSPSAAGQAAPTSRSAPPGGTATPAANPATTASAAAPASGASLLPKNAYLPVRVLALQLPTAAQSPLTPSGPLSFIGTVTGATVDGQTVVSTPNGLLTLGTRSAAPIGTQLLLEVAGRASVPQSATPALPHGMAPSFEALRQAIDALQIATPAVAQNIVQQLIPQPGPQMGLAMVFFLQALRGGALDRWLGQDGMRALKRAAGSGALEQEFASMRGRARDGAGADWRLFHLPVLTADDIEPLRLYIKDRKSDADDDPEKEKPGQRFVIEANFSRLGPFQFDGLVREKQLTLMIRTMQPVSREMRADIQSLFTTALESLGLTGSVGYHVVKAFDLVPIGDDPADRSSGVTV
ncbi:MAG: hypothetical protein RIM72_19075 [Alphaproteobacteria bacterium]